MCNPRRIRVRATRALHEAWQREVSRAVQLTARVRGEASIRRSLDASLGGPTLRALEMHLANPESGWTPLDGGFRCLVEGGHITYRVEERTLEITATLEDEVCSEGRTSAVLAGEVRDELEVEGEGRYYDDGWGGRTRERAEREAEADAEQKLLEAGRLRLDEAAEAAEAEAARALEAAARAEAETGLSEAAAARRRELEAAARIRLEEVGVRCRQAFHQALAHAYRDAILAYARTHRAEGIQCRETGDAVEIEFCLRA